MRASSTVRHWVCVVPRPLVWFPLVLGEVLKNVVELAWVFRQNTIGSAFRSWSRTSGTQGSCSPAFQKPCQYPRYFQGIRWVQWVCIGVLLWRYNTTWVLSNHACIENFCIYSCWANCERICPRRKLFSKTDTLSKTFSRPIDWNFNIHPMLAQRSRTSQYKYRGLVGSGVNLSVRMAPDAGNPSPFPLAYWGWVTMDVLEVESTGPNWTYSPSSLPSLTTWIKRGGA